MKAYILDKTGKPSVLKMATVPDPIPGPGEVQVRVDSIGLNYAEVLSRKGMYGWAPRRPYIPGMEAYGEVYAIGNDVTSHHQGDRVIVGTQYGAYAEKIAVNSVQALPALETFSPEENAAFAINYMTAWVSLFEMARLRPEDAVLIHAAAGGVGTAAVQLARNFGCKVYGTAGNDEKLKLLSDLGVEGPINYRKTDFESDLRARTDGRGVDVILEVVGGETYRKSLRLLRPLGRIVVAGFASINLQKWNPLSWIRTLRDAPRARIRTMAEQSIGIMATHLGYLLKDPEIMNRVWQEMVNFVEKHQIRPIVGHVFPFSQMAEAHTLMESRESQGKIVLKVGTD